MRAILIVHYREEIDKFKFILPKLGEIHAVCDTQIGLSNTSKWTYNDKLILEETGVPHRPWWYILARHCDDYRFYKRLPNSPYYRNRAWKSYGKHKYFVWLPLGFLKRFWQAPKYIQEHIQKLKPDIILTTSLAFPPLHVATEYALEGQRLGIPVISLVPNHDALSTKSVIYPKPDYLFVWNQNHVDEAVNYHGIAPETIYKVGAWSFEDWLQVRPTRRDKFCKAWGLNPKKPIFTYLTSSHSISGLEVDGVTQWRDFMRESYPDVQLVVRPHPDKVHLMSQIEGVKCIPKISQGIFEIEARQLAVDTYAHSEVCHGINTTAFIEAMLVGTKCYAIDTNLHETQRDCRHFQQLKELLDENGPKNVREWLNIGEKLPSDIVYDIIEKIVNKKTDLMFK